MRRAYLEGTARCANTTSLASDAVRSCLYPHERDHCDDPILRTRYRMIRIDRNYGHPFGAHFWHDTELDQRSRLDEWPQIVVVKTGSYEGRQLIGCVEVHYPDTKPVVSGTGVDGQYLEIHLETNERIIKISTSIACTPKGVNAPSWLKFCTNTGKEYEIGKREGTEHEWTPYNGTVGFKGFYGGCDVIVYRLGVIWSF